MLCKKPLPNKSIVYLLTAILGLSLSLLVLGCSSASHPSNHNDKLRTPFIPPANESVFTGYPSELPPQNGNGSASLRLDNSHNGFHVKAALFKVINNGMELTAICIIRKGDQFTLHNIEPGNYEVQFRNLYTGKYFRLSQPFSLANNTFENILLYQTEAGNFTIAPAPEAEF